MMRSHSLARPQGGRQAARPPHGGSPRPSLLRAAAAARPARRRGPGPARYQADRPTKEGDVTGIVFQPFEEVQVQLSALDKVRGWRRGAACSSGWRSPAPLTPATPLRPTPPRQVLDSGTTDLSYGRMNYSETLEAAVNEQVNVEYNMSYVYHAMATYFDR
jgi:hypothetical protein